MSEPRELSLEAYDLVDRLPQGPARAAAWNAYALQTYADNLMPCLGGNVEAWAETALVVDTCRQQAVEWVELAHADRLDVDVFFESKLPRWHTPLRSIEQLGAMRKTLEALRTHVAYDLRRVEDEAVAARLGEELARVDAKLARVDLLWIEHPPAEIRGGIGDALTSGLDEAYELGQRTATS